MTERLTYESIYDNHYEGETYRFGVAYLREEASGHDPDEYTEPYPSLEDQRRIIERLAHAAETLVIAEFIDQCGQIPALDRAGLSDLLDFWHDTHPQVMFAATEDVLGLDTSDTFSIRNDLSHGYPESVIITEP